MSGRAGVELTPTAVRLVRLAPLTGRVTHTVEIPWDPARPVDAVIALRAKIGSLQELALTVGMGFLEVARLDLPPVDAIERARIVELEPDRYIAAASRETLAVTVAPSESIAFAVPAALVASWLSAFEAWAPVEWVEPAPFALARLLERNVSGTYLVEAGEGEFGLMQLARGRLVSIRRTSDASAVRDARSLPAVGTVPAPFAAALGASRWNSGRSAPVAALAPDEWRRRQKARARAATLLNTAMAIIAAVFALWSADRWRERTLAALEQRIVEAESRGASADAALRALRSREAEARAIHEFTTNRADPHGALAAISAALPRTASVLSARASGNDWQIDGTASDASVLVPLLDRLERFDSVRFLSASSRYREGNRSYETFSIGLRVRPSP